MATKVLAFPVTVIDLSKRFGSKSPQPSSKVRVFTLRCSAGERPWKTSDARLVLEDGSIWKAKSFGATGTQVGEVVFNTSLTGYQEILTDPSYAGQFVLMTNPHIGNTGVNFGEYSYRLLNYFLFCEVNYDSQPHLADKGLLLLRSQL
ncbi:hypothetical protein Ahy_A10g050065 isoform B [Arachis hypogaea]|uniref:Carbamoyl-phosphate synthase small subunit N-terminal domain-containing protein n=1 Tax=Arachis hypogaea TaxID=3818 RepID=A0A445B8K3_ARAHY|nr:hypothetical protein Ahy_A10g050065 isoform A [Arachis hypogaea]RYR34990.1 hypothetical protein Ahy_A10g050065 isoform B [Arachis hypogaea]